MSWKEMIIAEVQRALADMFKEHGIGALASFDVLRLTDDGAMILDKDGKGYEVVVTKVSA